MLNRDKPQDHLKWFESTSVHYGEGPREDVEKIFRMFLGLRI